MEPINENVDFFKFKLLQKKKKKKKRKRKSLKFIELCLIEPV